MADWADRILPVGLLQGKEAWQFFRRNCRKLDQKENHLLYRSLLAARLDGWLFSVRCSTRSLSFVAGRHRDFVASPQC